MDLSHLNPAQRAAVTAPDGPHLVIAGAGTGKTQTLVHRVAWLIEQGIPARQIALLTFTRRAAKEMIHRAAQIVGPEANLVRGGTFHGFAVTLLRRHGAALELAPNFNVLDSEDAGELIGVCRTQLGLAGSDRRFPVKKSLAKVISRAANTDATLAQVLAKEYPQYEADLADIERVAALYEKRKREQGVLDFDDLLLWLDRLLTEHEAVRHEVSSVLRHVLVDEYQDTNSVQARLSALLAMSWGNLMVVGDEAQSIYAFRGAVVENILSFPDLFPDTQLTRLETNYRSVQPVLDLANGVLDAATRGYDKRLTAVRPGGEPVRLARPYDEHEQAEFIVRAIRTHCADGGTLNDVAILFRSAYHANLVELALGEARMPFQKFGGISFTQLAHVKDVLALLRVTANPLDELAWMRILAWYPKVGPGTAAKLFADIAAQVPPSLHAAKYSAKPYGKGLSALQEALEAASAAAADPVEALSLLIEAYKPLLADRFEDAKHRARDLDSLLLVAERKDDLSELIADLVLDPLEGTEASEAKEDEVLTLSTIHSAKGLEWPLVFVLNLVDGHFPAGYALDDEDALEEERRLFYVAVTRAKDQLTLLQPQFLARSWGQGIMGSCALLDTITAVETLYEEVSARPPRPEATGKPPPSPDINAAKDRMAAFLSFHKRKS